VECRDGKCEDRGGAWFWHRDEHLSFLECWLEDAKRVFLWVDIIGWVSSSATPSTVFATTRLPSISIVSLLPYMIISMIKIHPCPMLLEPEDVAGCSGQKEHKGAAHYC
jgi:hypothetical protein